MHDLENLCRRLSDDPRVQAIYLFGSAAAGARDAAAVDMFEHRAIMTYMDTAHLRRMVSEILREATR